MKKMKIIHFITLFLSLNFCYAQGFKPAETICLGNNSPFFILETYKDNQDNEYVIYGKPNITDSLDIYIQKYDSNEKPVFSDCGIYLKTTSTVIINLGIGILKFVQCITDANNNIFIVISVPIGNDEAGFETFNLSCFKLNVNGTKLWEKSNFFPTHVYIFQTDIEMSPDGDIHLLYFFDETRSLGYLRFSNDGILRYPPKDFGTIYYVDLTTTGHPESRKYCQFFKNSSNEVIIAKANFDFNVNSYTISTSKIDINGNQQDFIVDDSSPAFLQFNKLNGEFYYIKSVATQFLMYKFNSESSISPQSVVTFDSRPFQELQKKGEFYFYLYNHIQGGKTYLQKINGSSQKQYPDNSFEMPYLSGAFEDNIQIFPDNKGGVHLLFINEKFTLENNQFNNFERYLSYQYVNTFGIAQIPNDSKLFFKCGETYVSTGKGFLDENDGSLNAYISHYGSFTALSRQNVYYLQNSNCIPYIIVKSK